MEFQAFSKSSKSQAKRLSAVDFREHNEDTWIQLIGHFKLGYNYGWSILPSSGHYEK